MSGSTTRCGRRGGPDQLAIVDDNDGPLKAVAGHVVTQRAAESGTAAGARGAMPGLATLAGNCYTLSMPERSLPEIRVHPASPEDVDDAVATITAAFSADPVWQPALEAPDGSTEHVAVFWRFFVEGARRYDSVWVSDGARTVSVWIPPGGDELSTEQEQAVQQLVRGALGPDRVDALFDL